jgi:hypothetical protein
MTSKRIAEVVKARQFARMFTLREDFVSSLRALVDRLDAVTWPSPRWKDDPVAFTRDVFGLELMAHQQDMLRAIARYPQVAIRSGNKAGKSLVVVLAALHFYCSHVDARVVMISSTAGQTDSVLWRQLVMLVRRAKVPIDGDLAKLA